MLFYQPENGYRFNSDSIFLYDFIRSFSPKGDLLDVGCGVGVIGLLLARDFGLRPTLVEKQPLMAAYARRNAEVNGIEAKVEVCDFLDYRAGNRFDFVVSNPPFYHEDVIQSEDPHLHACRYNLHLPPAPFFSKVGELLKPRGHFLFCYDASQIGDILRSLVDAALTVEHLRFVHPRARKPAKLVMVHARSGSRAKTVVLNPLVPFGDDGYGPEARRIFKEARTHTIKCQID